jgi:hypothetical protein
MSASDSNFAAAPPTLATMAADLAALALAANGSIPISNCQFCVRFIKPNQTR